MALIGSARHLIGSGSDGDALKQVARFVDQELSGPMQQYEFLGRRLLQGTLVDQADRNFDVVVGTPLYVALAEHGQHSRLRVRSTARSMATAVPS